MRYLILALLLLGACGGSSVYHLSNGDYTEAELRRSLKQIVAIDSDACPQVRVLDDNDALEAMSGWEIFSNDRQPGDYRSQTQTPTQDAIRAMQLLRDICD